MKKSSLNDDVADYFGVSSKPSADRGASRTSFESLSEKTEETSYSSSSSGMQSGSRYSSDSGSSYSSSSSSGYYAGGGYETPSSSGNDGGDGDDDRNSYSSSEPSEKNEKKSKALPVILISTGVAIMAGIGVTVAVNSKSSGQKPLDAESGFRCRP